MRSCAGGGFTVFIVNPWTTIFNGYQVSGILYGFRWIQGRPPASGTRLSERAARIVLLFDCLLTFLTELKYRMEASTPRQVFFGPPISEFRLPQGN